MLLSSFHLQFVLFALFSLIKAQTPITTPVVLEPGSNDDLCMTADANTDGATVTLRTCDGSNAQKWTYTGGQVINYGSKKCLDVKDGTDADGTKVQMWSCTGGNTNQQWYYTGDKRLAWTNHGRCLDITDGKIAAGTQLQVWNCYFNNVNQVWQTGHYVTSPTLSSASTPSTQVSKGQNMCKAR